MAEKPISEFTKRGSKPGSWCKLCYNSYKRDNGYNAYSERPEYYASAQRRIRQTERHKQQERGYRKKYGSTFSGMVTSLLCNARDRAKKNELQIDLDRSWIEQHLQPLICEATGVVLVLERQSGVSHSPFRPSIDRIDNNKGYTKDNCRIVCVIYNKAKSDYSDLDVVAMAKGLVQKCT
jgi:hypothetical protein